MLEHAGFPPSGAQVDRPYPRDTALARALLANALFSALSGTLLLGAPALVATLLGVAAALPVQFVGAGLVAFGLAVAVLSARRPVHPGWALAVTVADLGWVVGSVAGVVVFSDVLTGVGRAAVLAVALVVGLFALFQLRGLVLFARNVGGRSRARSRFLLARPVAGDPEVVWARLRALDRIGEHYDALTEVEVREVDGVLRRTCATGDGGRWSEEVVEMDDRERALVLRFDTTTGRFPLPVTTMLGGWQVWPHGAGSFLVLWYEYTLRGGLVGEVLAALADPLFRRRLGPVFQSLGARQARGDGVEVGRSR